MVVDVLVALTEVGGPEGAAECKTPHIEDMRYSHLRDHLTGFICPYDSHFTDCTAYIVGSSCSDGVGNILLQILYCVVSHAPSNTSPASPHTRTVSIVSPLYVIAVHY